MAGRLVSWPAAPPLRLQEAGRRGRSELGARLETGRRGGAGGVHDSCGMPVLNGILILAREGSHGWGIGES